MNQKTPALYAMVLRKADRAFIFATLSARRYTRTELEDSALSADYSDEDLGSALMETLWVDTDDAALEADPPPDTLAEEYLAWLAPLYEAGTATPNSASSSNSIAATPAWPMGVSR